MKGEVDFLVNFPIDTSPKKKTHSAMQATVIDFDDKNKFVFFFDRDL